MWNQENIDEFTSLIYKLIDLLALKKISPEWIIFDMEPHLDLLLQLERKLKRWKFISAKSLINNWQNQSETSAARIKLKALLEYLENKNIKFPVYLGCSQDLHWIACPVFSSLNKAACPVLRMAARCLKHDVSY